MFDYVWKIKDEYALINIIESLMWRLKSIYSSLDV